MILVSVSGSVDDLAAVSGEAGLLDCRTTADSGDQGTVVGYADDDVLAQLNNMNVVVDVIDDAATVDSDFDTALSEIEPDQ